MVENRLLVTKVTNIIRTEHPFRKFTSNHGLIWQYLARQYNAKMTIKCHIKRYFIPLQLHILAGECELPTVILFLNNCAKNLCRMYHL